MNSFKQIIDAFTIKSLAEILGVAESHVRTMRARGSIPPEYWSKIIELAPSNIGVSLTLDGLLEIRKNSLGKTGNEASI